MNRFIVLWMLTVTFFCAAGITNNHEHAGDWFIAAAIWCGALLFAFIAGDR